MKSECVIRDEPGKYRVTARFLQTGAFMVFGETDRPITLTVRVEDVWERISEAFRKHTYSVVIWRDDSESPSNILEEVAPDARIFLDFNRSFRMEFK